MLKLQSLCLQHRSISLGDMRMHTSQNFSAFSGIGHHIQLIAGLAVEPELRAVAEIGRQPHSGVSGNASLPGNDVLNAALRHTRVQGQTGLAQAHRPQELLIENFARMHGRHTVMHDAFLMVVNNFNHIR